jgi:hypothetical protein
MDQAERLEHQVLLELLELLVQVELREHQVHPARRVQAELLELQVRQELLEQAELLELPVQVEHLVLQELVELLEYRQVKFIILISQLLLE